ncbi:peptidoglycan-binding protein LysM [Sphingomonas sp. HMWF008]|nr:peptidoglycan-binding protein LysM [Sphingomonas sp. HMWF008]
MSEGLQRGSRDTAFSIYLRTGQRVANPPIELKFNPYHDPRNGRFTFAPGGSTGNAAPPRTARATTGKTPPKPVKWGGDSFTGGGGSFGGAGATGDGYWLNPREVADFKRKHPKMKPVVVEPGDTIGSVARANHLTATELAASNRMSVDAKLKPGDVLAIPSPNSRAPKAAPASKLTAPVSRAAATRDPYRHQLRNGYDYAIDDSNRTRRTKGELSSEAATRSRRNQAAAGGTDRLRSDDGGHYIAARFNGPRDAFNHFAQDSNFNRGAYRQLEESWARAQRSGHRIYVDIVPEYRGASKRPYSLEVTWYDNGKRRSETFSNSKKGR